MALLSVNAGSSSLKVSVYDRDSLESPLDSLSLEEIPPTLDALRGAVEQVQQWLDEKQITIEAIGHRVVHGGDRYSSAQRITPELLIYLETLTPLAPNHMPSVLAALRTFQHIYPQVEQVACFDTSFFHNIPEVAQVLPIPLSLQKDANIRRYGFHGLSYEGLLDSFRTHEGDIAAHGRVIMLHLGSGASIAALKNGAPVDMSMGFTPISGIMMSTRSGDIEPGVLTYLANEKGMSTDEISHLLSHESGLKGVSEMTSDMHALLDAQSENPKAALAVELFCSKIRKTIGAYAAVLGGVDSIIFSGGIGERSAEIRRRICSNFEFLGITIDEDRNQRSERLISSDQSSVGVHVILAREDHSIITQTLSVINQGATQ